MNGTWGWPDDDEDQEDRHYKEQWEATGAPWDDDMGTSDSHESLNADHQLASLIRSNPEAVAMLLRQWDMGEDDVYEAIRDYKAWRED